MEGTRNRAGGRQHIHLAREWESFSGFEITRLPRRRLKDERRERERRGEEGRSSVMFAFLLASKPKPWAGVTEAAGLMGYEGLVRSGKSWSGKPDCSAGIHIT